MVQKKFIISSNSVKRFLMISIFSVLMIMVISTFLSSSLGQTIHQGSTSGDETWNQADNPHFIPNSFTVSNGDTVTVQPGCNIRFDSGSDLTVSGALLAIGTEEENIVFEPNDIFTWGDIEILETSGNSTIFDFCDISSGNQLTISSSSPVITNSTIHDLNGDGIYLTGTAHPIIYKNEIFNSDRGIFTNVDTKDGGGVISENTMYNINSACIWVSGNTTVKNNELRDSDSGISAENECVVDGNDISNMEWSGIDCRDSVKVMNNSISSCTFGIDLSGGEVDISTNHISNTASYGIWIRSDSPIISYTDIVDSNIWDIFIETDSHPSLVGGHFDLSKVRMNGQESSLLQGWYVTIAVMNQDGSLSDATVNIVDALGHEKTYKTDSNGIAGNLIIAEHKIIYNESSDEYNLQNCTPHNITVMYDGAKSKVTFSVSENSEMTITIDTKNVLNDVEDNVKYIIPVVIILLAVVFIIVYRKRQTS